MSPVYKKDGGWFFELFMVEFGPYESEDVAWEKFEQVSKSSECKNCGE
jgi:hypothetical protein